MPNWTRIGIGASVRGGTVLLTYVLLSPAIWSRPVFNGFEVAAALAIGGGIRRDRCPAPVRVWVRNLILTAVGLTATMVAIAVLLQTALGEQTTLVSTQQRIAFGTAAALTVGFWVGLSRPTRITAITDLEGETRRNAIRANIRKEIDEIEKATGGPSDPSKHGDG